MRKLAREAVIFMLLGMLLTAAGGFLYEHHAQWKLIRSQREALKEDCNRLFARSPADDIAARFADKSGTVGYSNSAQAECA